MLRFTSAVLAALSLSLAFGANAFASDPTGTADYGSPASQAAATRTITVAPGEKAINVTRGETVTIVVGQQRFSWNVQTYSNTTVFPLAEIAPKEMSTEDILVYVASNPLYSGS
ncbi:MULTISPECIES: CzcE family metal-binding protein [unclassified Janthinobacterium]|uniref:CzcE family metal-binding protein n=1 Tax=unclassified Janthinobacterium TaxID=2610881 RepID=UPI0016114E77|nr:MULTISPECIES: CzcE family metal-binding protein [unclassified Janthinobacterium]MBB5608166.1 putative cupredoxin-like copper-binding protein [Janthinobacterium sp. S3T4]MBB5613492.1 putative cupredoxin-like copper-binding protein [Janthinobacterium sp. S3M3]